MDIDTGDSPPVSQRPYTLPLKHHEWVKSKIETLEDAGIIHKSFSPWASPIVIVPKKSEKGEPMKRRMCMDFQKINALQPETITRQENRGNLSLQPLPKIDEMYAKLKGAKFFTTLDLCKVDIITSPSHQKQELKQDLWHHVENMSSIKYHLDWHKHQSYFQELIWKVIGNVPYAMGYLDDIIIFSNSIRHINDIFEKLRKAGLKLKLSKCAFFKKRASVLRTLSIWGRCMTTTWKTRKHTKHASTQKCTKEVKQFLGLVGYYQKFVPHFSDIACPLSKLTAKEQIFKWTDLCQSAFKMLKEKLCHEPILKYPDTSKPYTLFTDASNYGWAGVLTHEHNSIDSKGNQCTTLHPVAYVSGLFRGSQLNWAALTKEAYTIYICVKQLTFYISGTKVTLRSDHLPLKKFLLKNTPNEWVNRWAMEIEDYQIDFNHTEGKNNILVDTLSRLINSWSRSDN